MASEPSESERGTFESICNIYDVGEMMGRLRANGNNINDAVNDFFDGSSKYEAAKNSSHWDETAFGMSRDGTEQAQSNNPSFRIDAIGDDLAQGHPSVPPSRPPSRANSRTPASNHGSSIEHWQRQTAEVAMWPDPREDQTQTGQAQGYNYPATVDDADADLQRALDASRRDAGIQPQETGVTSATTAPAAATDHEPKFGPAQRPDDEYAPEKWAVVTAGYHDQTKNTAAVASNSTEVYEEPASTRIRKHGAPAFLLSGSSEKIPPLAAMLTIFHEIPAARNALLRMGEPARKYLHHPAWWKGTPIENPTSGDPLSPTSQLCEEVHRLMAFLDSTERSYGSVDPLLAASTLSGDADPLSNFVVAAEDVLPTDARRVLYSQISEHFRKSAPEWNADSMTQEISVVDYSPANWSQEGYPPLMGLYDLITMCLWDKYILPPHEQDDPHAYIREPGQVITFRWEGDKLGNDIEIPELLYIDRYLESLMSVGLSIKEGIVAAAEMLANIRRWEDGIFKCHTPDAKLIPRIPYLTRMIERSQAKLAAVDEAAAWRAADAKWKASRERQKRGIEPTKEDLDPEKYKPRLTEEEEKRKKYWQHEISLFQEALEITERSTKLYKASTAFFEAVHSLVTDRMTGSNTADLTGLFGLVRKQLTGAIGEAEADDLIAKFQTQYPGVIDIEGWKDPLPTHKYLLRGVAVGGKTVYVCRRASIDTGDESERWWKLEYREDETEPAKAEIVDEMTVRIAAGKTQDKPILVYASPEAIVAPPDPLPEALSFFVKSDNHVFRNEVSSEGERQAAAPQEPIITPAVSGKRKYSASSVDSAATNRASCGGNSDIGGAKEGPAPNSAMTSPFFSVEDSETDQNIFAMVDFSERMPSSAVSSAVDKSKENVAGPSKVPSGTRRRKTMESQDQGGSEHVEWTNEPATTETTSQPAEMQSRNSIPLIGIGKDTGAGTGAGNAKADSISLVRQDSSGVDMMNMDVHEHED